MGGKLGTQFLGAALLSTSGSGRLFLKDHGIDSAYVSQLKLQLEESVTSERYQATSRSFSSAPMPTTRLCRPGSAGLFVPPRT